MAEKKVSSERTSKSVGRECAAFGCSNTFYRYDGTPSGLHFFKFPQKNPEKRTWCNLIKRVDGMDGFRVSSATCLCQEHFKDDDIKRNPRRWKLMSGAVPSLNLHKRPSPRPTRKAPKIRNAQQIAKEETEAARPSSTSPLPSSSLDEEMSTNSYSASTEHQYSLPCSSLYQEVQDLKAQIKSLQEENKELKERLFSLEKLKSDDSAVRFYTGFPNFATLLDVFHYFQPKLEHITYWRGTATPLNPAKSDKYCPSSKPGAKRKLSLLEEFVFVLMRLKVGLFLNDLADRFGISVAQASKIFTTWISFLHHELQLLFPFPSRAKIDSLLPNEFARYPTTRIIIDCTELFIEVPSSLRAQSQTWSEYKHHNTWKALVGISPNGAITFISKLWSGRVSDKEITKKCGVLALLEPGDNVMADRGFDIHDILPSGVTLNIPPFKGTREQLTPEETEETAHIASVRIHVERAIGRVKNYHILDGVLPLSLHPIANQIFTVCCYLTNFLPFLVKSGKS